ncbi:MAG: hypothetical protein PHG85_02150 [Candidatus Altiarchaeota archaeon]|nr:hypothetical protein [Candidatus Altiarchaeota archaeon]
MDSLSRENVLDALRKGRCFVSNDNDGMDGFIELYAGNVSNVGMAGDVLQSSGVVNITVLHNVAHDCELVLVKGLVGSHEEPHGFGLVQGQDGSPHDFNDIITQDTYYRVECVSPDGGWRTYTNPVWIMYAAQPQLKLVSYTVSDSGGDGLINDGDSVSLKSLLKNSGSQTAGGVTVRLSSASGCVSFSDGIESYGDIPAGESVDTPGDFDFDVDCGVGTVMPFTLDINDSRGRQWTGNFNLTVEGISDFVFSNPTDDGDESSDHSYEVSVDISSIMASGLSKAAFSESDLPLEGEKNLSVSNWFSNFQIVVYNKSADEKEAYEDGMSVKAGECDEYIYSGSADVIVDGGVATIGVDADTTCAESVVYLLVNVYPSGGGSRVDQFISPLFLIKGTAADFVSVDWDAPGTGTYDFEVRLYDDTSTMEDVRVADPGSSKYDPDLNDVFIDVDSNEYFYNVYSSVSEGRVDLFWDVDTTADFADVYVKVRVKDAGTGTLVEEQTDGTYRINGTQWEWRKFTWTAPQSGVYDIYLRLYDSTGILEDTVGPSDYSGLDDVVMSIPVEIESVKVYWKFDDPSVDASNKNGVKTMSGPSGSTSGTWDASISSPGESEEGKVIYWRIYAEGNDGSTHSWSLTPSYAGGEILDEDTQGPIFKSYRDSGDSEPGSYSFRIKLYDASGILDDGTYPLVYYRWDDDVIDEFGYSGYADADFDYAEAGGDWYKASINVPESKRGSTLYWRALAGDKDNSPAFTWGSVQLGGVIPTTTTTTSTTTTTTTTTSSTSTTTATTTSTVITTSSTVITTSTSTTLPVVLLCVGSHPPVEGDWFVGEPTSCTFESIFLSSNGGVVVEDGNVLVLDGSVVYQSNPSLVLGDESVLDVSNSSIVFEVV